MIRNLLLFCCLLFGAVSAAFAQLAQQGLRAQGFKVSVFNDAQEPLIGAYIYVNDKPTAATDTLGLAVIPLEKIKLGDSISVSYVFTKGQSVAVDHIMLIKGEYQFILEETHGTLHAEAVTVKAKIKRLYRRSLPITRRPPYIFYNLYRTHFAMNITNPGDSVPSHWVAGRVEGIYTSLGHREHVLPQKYRSIAIHALNPDPTVFDSLLKDPRYRVGFVSDLPLEIITNDDTTNLEQTLKYFLPRVLRATNIALYRVYDPEPDYKELKIFPEAKVNYGYLGKDQDTSTFRLTYSGHGAGTTSEVVVISDVTNKINRELAGASLSFKDSINGNSYYVKIKTRTKMISEDKSIGLGDVWQVPTELKYFIKESDGTTVDITMSNIHLRSLWEKMNIPKAIIVIDSRPFRDFLAYKYYETEMYFERVVYDKKRREEREQRKASKEKRKASHIN